MYGDKNVKFTLKMFEDMNKNKQKLQQFRRVLKSIQMRLKSQAENNNSRVDIPSTFDAMMADFGTRVQRRQLLEDFDFSTKSILD